MSVRAPSRTDALELFGKAFREVNAALRRMKGRQAHHPGGLSYAQFGLLFTLAERAALSLREIALAAGVSPATAAEMLDGLAASGLVDRVRSTDDKRIVLSSLTKRGLELVAARRSLYEPRWRAALREFSEEELLTAAAVLDRIRAMFDELAETEL